MERSYRGHLKDRKGWSHSHRDIKTDRDTMIEQGMSDAKKVQDEVDFSNKGTRQYRGQERDML